MHVLEAANAMDATLTCTFGDLENVSLRIAEADGQHPYLLTQDERDRYLEMAKAAARAFGIELDNGRGL